FSSGVAEKPMVVVISKMDIAPEGFVPPKFRGLKTILISSVTDQGLNELKNVLWMAIQATKEDTKQNDNQAGTD
ncbi:MAG: GTPase ObgE, partial [Chlorobiales bacterium]|nr:GTPase ObgE [Chlorobiales bacterium]